MSILDYIIAFAYEFFVAPIMRAIDNTSSIASTETPITLTMPGSDIVLFSTNLHDLIWIGFLIFLFIASITFFWGVIKMLYKVGRSMFGGRR